jgi:hypothetical protein
MQEKYFQYVSLIFFFFFEKSEGCNFTPLLPSHGALDKSYEFINIVQLL